MVADGANTYGYDAENRLISTSFGVSMGYDPLGRLFQLGTPGGTRQMLYDGDQLVGEYDQASGATLGAYVHGPAEDDPLAWYDSAGFVRLLHTDHQGSIIGMAGGPEGRLAATNAYDEYGAPRSGNTGRFQYTGQAWLAELGMYYYKARIYSPKLGRFLQTDPIGTTDQINLYAYVGNDPANNTDPTGNSVFGACGRGTPECLESNEKKADSQKVNTPGQRQFQTAIPARVGTRVHLSPRAIAHILMQHGKNPGTNKPNTKFVGPDGRTSLGLRKGSLAPEFQSATALTNLIGRTVANGISQKQGNGNTAYTSSFPFPVGDTGETTSPFTPDLKYASQPTNMFTVIVSPTGSLSDAMPDSIGNVITGFPPR